MPKIEDKAVKRTKITDFLTPQKGKKLDEAGAKNNTVFLFTFLKKLLDGVAFDNDKGMVVANGYAIFFTGDSYKLQGITSGKLVKTLPDPKSVAEFVKENPLSLKKEMTPEEMQKAEAAGRLAKNHPLKETTIEEDNSLKLTPTAKKVMNAVSAILDGVKEEVYSLGKVRQIINDKIAAEDTPRYEKLVGFVKSFMSEKIDFEAMSKGFDEEIQPLMEVVRTKAEKFDGLDEVRFLNNGTIKITKNSIEGQVEEDDKPVNKEMTKMEYLVNIVLSHFPKAMPLIMKLAQGKVTFTSGEDTYDLLNEATYRMKNFVPDSYEPFDEKVLSDSKHKDKVVAFCEYFLSFKGIPTAYTIHFDAGIKRGDKLRVKWSGYHCHWDGTVMASKYGINIFYEDGYRFYLQNEQKFEAIGEASQEEMTKLEGATAEKAVEVAAEEKE